MKMLIITLLLAVGIPLVGYSFVPQTPMRPNSEVSERAGVKAVIDAPCKDAVVPGAQVGGVQ
jgi:hypothetical protein